VLPLDAGSEVAENATGLLRDGGELIPAEPILFSSERFDPRRTMGHREQNGPYLVFILALSVYALGALAVRTVLPLSPETRTILEYADVGVCVLFFLDFLISLARAEDRTRYFLRWGWLDLLSSIPVVDSLRWTRGARVFRILRVLRAVRATRILAQFLIGKRAQSAFLAAFLITILVVVASAIAVLQVETSPDANIRTPEDALWWAMTTITTVGYGDRYPVSSEGRIIAVLLMAMGMGLFGAFSGFVASWFLRPEEVVQKSELDEVLAEVRALREELRRPPLEVGK
jgi:voltage-gated potassium channel